MEGKGQMGPEYIAKQISRPNAFRHVIIGLSSGLTPLQWFVILPRQIV